MNDLLLLVGHRAKNVIISGIVAVLDTIGGTLKSSTDHEVHNVLLLISELVKDLPDGRVVIRGGVLNLLLDGAESTVLKLKTSKDNGLVLKRLDVAIAVCNTNLVDQGTRVGTRKDQTNLSNNTVDNILATTDNRLLELVGVDREVLDVLVLNQKLSILTLLGSIEISVRVHTIIASLEDCVTENILRPVVAMLPDEGNGHTIHVLKRFGSNRPTVGALETSLSGIAAEISVIHVDCPSYLLLVTLAPTELDVRLLRSIIASPLGDVKLPLGITNSLKRSLLIGTIGHLCDGPSHIVE